MSPSAPKRGRPATGKTPTRAIRVTEAEWEAWRAKAEAAGLSLAEWLRRLANAALTEEKMYDAYLRVCELAGPKSGPPISREYFSERLQALNDS